MPTKPPLHRPPGWKPPAPYVPADRAHDLMRGTAASRGYDSKWTRTRNRYLQTNPLCVECTAAGSIRIASEVHHIIPIKVDQTKKHDPANLMALCHGCHMRIEANLKRTKDSR